MPNLTTADSIRILVATDNHVGYNERDATRGDDSWKSFHEVMCLAKDRDVDMVLLAGDLFHDNKPSRKSLYQVMRSLRMNCYGEKPCELEMLSDASETFAGAFNHVNYEDPDINVAIPVFSIHGNHDDPSGEGHLAALDILEMSGLINYYGRTPESDNILIKPILLQKGNTKLALYGMSNVRDERLFRTFRDGKVKFFQPGTQKDDWFNIMSVHQNRHAYTDTGYLPENFLPSFLDLIIWGHEHECKIEPSTNAETSFRVMQPGSSVATSLVKGESEPKHVAIVTVTGKEFRSEPIRLKTTRPFVMKEIALTDYREMRDIAEDDNNRPKITRFLESIIEDLIEQAKQSWRDARQDSEHADEDDDEEEPPLPLIRLRVEYTAPEGGKFDCENPQRFSNRFIGKVANLNDVIQFHRKRTATTRTIRGKPDMPEESIMAQLSIDNVKVDKLVREFLTAQSLTILPQNSFSDAVGQFVDKDDKHAMETFVDDSLKTQVAHLLAGDDGDDVDEDQMAEMMEEFKATLEQAFERGELKRSKRKGSRKPKPDYWDSDVDGPWDDNALSIVRLDDDSADGEGADDDGESSVVPPPKKAAPRGRGGKAAARSTNDTAAAIRKPPAKVTDKRRKKESIPQNEDDNDDDVIMLDNDDDENDNDDAGMFVKPAQKAPVKRVPAPKKNPPAKSGSKTQRRDVRQSQLSFVSQSQTNGRVNANGRSSAPSKRVQEPSEDEISDDDAFEPPPATSRIAKRR